MKAYTRLALLVLTALAFTAPAMAQTHFRPDTTGEYARIEIAQAERNLVLTVTSGDADYGPTPQDRLRTTKFDIKCLSHCQGFTDYSEFYDGDGFLGVMQYDLNSDNLITYWGGHAYTVRVFSLSESKVVKVLDENSYDSPQIRKTAGGVTEIVTSQKLFRPNRRDDILHHTYRIPLRPAAK